LARSFRVRSHELQLLGRHSLHLLVHKVIAAKVLMLNLALRNAHRADLTIFNGVGEREYLDKWEKTAWATVIQLRDALFKEVTGEKASFDVFYDMFGAPGCAKNKPIAWVEGKGFIPDRINDILMDDKVPTHLKVYRVKRLYSKCKKLQKAK
jgi:hypothetical protein